MKLPNLWMIGILFTVPMLHAIRHEHGGTQVEIVALQPHEYAINTHGWRITADQLEKKGFQAFCITMSNESDQVITVLPQLNEQQPTLAADVLSPFLYKTGLYIAIQECVGIGLLGLGQFMTIAELYTYGFTKCFAAQAKRAQIKIKQGTADKYKKDKERIKAGELKEGMDLVNARREDEGIARGTKNFLKNRDNAKDITSFLKLWREFCMVGVFGIGQYPPEYYRWLKAFKKSGFSQGLTYAGWAVVAAALITWIPFYCINAKGQQAFADLGLATKYDLMPGQSIKKIVVVKAKELGAFRCELYEPTAEDPNALFITDLKTLMEEQGKESNEIL